MFETNCDVAVIGGGPAGLAAAAAAKEAGANRVLILERDSALGGILQQCIHPGFGLTRFGEELTGPEYAGRFLARAEALGIEALLNTMVLSLDGEKRQIACINGKHGYTLVHAKSIVLAMGCRERTRAAIAVPGTRPSGLYTAGAAQRLINRENVAVGKKIVILGSGDIGMIMARRLTLEGAEVVAVVEIMDYLAGLTRNRVQCLDDFDIPLMLSHTITRIEGDTRVSGVWIAPVDGNKQPILEQEHYIPCDTVLFSVGLIPENELTRKAGIAIDPVTNGPMVNQYMQTDAPAIFACGNVVHVNDLVDNVSDESERAGRFAALYAQGARYDTARRIPCVPGKNVRYLCAQSVLAGQSPCERVTLYFRVRAPETNVTVIARCGDTVLTKQKEIRVNPGEMNHISFDCGALVGDRVTVDVVREA